MMWLNGSSSDIEVVALYDLLVAETVGSNSNVNIVAQLSRGTGNSYSWDVGNWTGAKRYYVQKDQPNQTNVFNSLELWKSDAIDTGDYKELVGFINWSKQNFPAENYVLIMFGHGSGMEDFLPRPSGIKATSFDGKTNNYISVVEMEKTLRETGGIDLLVYESCLMQMMEAAYQLKDVAKVIVGSEEVMHIPSYPYAVFLGLLSEQPSITIEQAAQFLVKNSDLSRGNGGTISALKTQRMTDFALKLNKWVQLVSKSGAGEVTAVNKHLIRFRIRSNFEEAEDRQLAFFVDLYDLIENYTDSMTGNFSETVAIKQLGSELLKFLSDEIVIANKTQGRTSEDIPYNRAKGVSIALAPRNPALLPKGFFEVYSGFNFEQDTNWSAFIKRSLLP